MARRDEISKAMAQRMHAKKRASQRYGLTLNRVQLDEIVEQIHLGRAKLVFRQSIRVAHYDVTIAGKVCRIVYDRNRKTVVTFLPLSTHAETENQADGQ